jgi:transposase
MKNVYKNKSKISVKAFKKLLKLFALDVTATEITELCSLNRNTINFYLRLIRERIAHECKKRAAYQDAAMERQMLKILPKMPTNKVIIGVLKDGDTIIYTKIKNNGALKHNLNNALVISLNGVQKAPYTVPDRSVDQMERKDTMSNEESFLKLTKERLLKFRGMSHTTFELHIKECEFRFNHRHENLYEILMVLFKANPLI